MIDQDSLHVFFYRDWNEEISNWQIIDYQGDRITGVWEKYLLENYGLDFPSYILGSVAIKESQKGYLIRHMGMYESNLISLIVEYPNNELNSILVARSGGDGAWMYREDSWIYDGDRDGDLDIFTWRKETWEDYQTEEWKSKEELTFRIWLDGRFVPNPSSVVDTTKFTHYFMLIGEGF